MTVQVADEDAGNWLAQAEDLTGEWKEIYTPLLDEINDQIVFYARVKDGYLVLRDGGETYANLEAGGHELIGHRLDDIIGDFGENITFSPDDDLITYVGKDIDRPAAFNVFAVCLAACLLENPINKYGEPKYD